MTETAKQARRAYKREWARKNPDKVKRHQETFWSKKAAELNCTTEPAADAKEQEQPQEGKA